ncbi:oligosaccharide flippase family protein [Fusobacterium nucleatum]|uniref:oligosaccharide flippase family protein n=1 Tax=Fusobacterium nucleatum TaxID=851 RepID=UPI001237BBBE|nr:oligosaccharide flippase family protein [Fusobacterium nucleatum]
MEKINILSAVKWSILAEVLAKLIVPFTTMVLARILDLDSFGVVTSIMLVITLADDIINVAFQKIIVQADVEKTEKIKKYADVAFWTNLVLSLFLWLIIIIFRHSIANFIKIEGKEIEIIIAATVLPLSSLSTVQESLYIKKLDYKMLYYNRCVSIAIPFLITIPLAFFLKNHWALIIGNVALVLVKAVHLTRKSEWKPRLKYDLSILVKIRFLLLFNILDAIIHWISTWVDIIIVTRVFGLYYSALYKTSQTIVTSVISIVTSGIAAILFSSLSYYKKDDEKFKEIFFNFQKGIAILTLPLGIGFLIYKETIVMILLGEKWLEATNMIGIWGLVTCIVATYGTFSKESYRAIGKPKISFYVQTIHTFFVLVIIFFTYSYGYDQFVIFRSLAFLQILLVHNIYMKKLFNIRILSMIKKNFYIIIASLLMGILGFILKIFSNSIKTDLLGIMLCSIFYFLILFKKKEYKDILLFFISKYKKRKE